MNFFIYISCSFTHQFKTYVHQKGKKKVLFNLNFGYEFITSCKCGGTNRLFLRGKKGKISSCLDCGKQEKFLVSEKIKNALFIKMK